MIADPKTITDVNVKLDDGSIWSAKWESGALQLVTQMVAPPAPKSYIEPPKPTPAKAPPTIRGGMAIPSMPERDDEDNEEVEDDKEKALSKADSLGPLEDSVFRARLSSIMTDNMFDRRLKGRARGRLDMTRLYKAEALASNIFTQKQARKNKQYNVVLLVDESGSMRGTRIEEAAQVACFLAKAFHGLNVELSVIGFNHYIRLYKKFSDPLPDLRLLKASMLYACHTDSTDMGAGCNNDFDAISFALKQFDGQAGKNVFIMLSDGEPAPSGQMEGVLKDPEYWHKHRAKNAHWTISGPDLLGGRREFWADLNDRDYESRYTNGPIQALTDKRTDVTSIGIGLQRSCWQIKNNIREDNMKQLKRTLLGQLEKQIKRG